MRDYNPEAKGAPVVLVVPSLINRFDILDLDQDFSLLRALAAHGFRPLVVDWNVPGEDEKDFSLSDYILKRLVPIIDYATSETQQLHLLGYCMGGLLSLALATLRREQLKTLTLMATPWDFHRAENVDGAAFVNLSEQLEPYLQELGHLPLDVIQSMFAWFQPMQAMKKFQHFAALDPDSLEARQFVLCEDWLNEGVPLTANAARACLRDWYGENQTGKIRWRIAGQLIDPRAINIPAYVIIPGKDRIVPPEQARPLARLLRHAVLHEPMLGHIGMIASRHAPHQVWQPLMTWMKGH